MERRRQNPPPDDFAGRAPTRVQTRTVTVPADELETVHEDAIRYAHQADIAAYLAAIGETGDEGTCMGDMVAPGELSPRVLPAPMPVARPVLLPVEPKTVHAYCEPMLPFLPVEDLAAPVDELELELEADDLYEPAPLAPLPIPKRIEDPILEYLREVSADFAPIPGEPTMLRLHDGDVPLVIPMGAPPPAIAPQPMSPEPTMPEQAAVHTSFVRYKGAPKSRSVRVLAVKKRRTPLWAAALMGALIAALLLTSSVFTVEVLASKLSQRLKTDAPKAAEQPWVVPR